MDRVMSEETHPVNDSIPLTREEKTLMNLLHQLCHYVRYHNLQGTVWYIDYIQQSLSNLRIRKDVKEWTSEEPIIDKTRGSLNMAYNKIDIMTKQIDFLSKKVKMLEEECGSSTVDHIEQELRESEMSYLRDVYRYERQKKLYDSVD